MVSNYTSSHFYTTRIFSILWTYFVLSLLVFVTQIVFITPTLGQGSKIVVRLSGDINYPGDLSVLNDTIKLKKVCFLGVDAKGKIDNMTGSKLLSFIADKSGVPVQAIQGVDVYDKFSGFKV